MIKNELKKISFCDEKKYLVAFSDLGRVELLPEVKINCAKLTQPIYFVL